MLVVFTLINQRAIGIGLIGMSLTKLSPFLLDGSYYENFIITFLPLWNQESKVSPLAIAIFLKYNSDPVITSLSQDIFKVLAANPGCSGPLQNRLVPTLVSILNASEDKNGLKGIALDVQSSLVRSSPLPLSEQLMSILFPAAIQVNNAQLLHVKFVNIHYIYVC